MNWHPVAGAISYKIQVSEDGEKSWADLEDDIKNTAFRLTDLTDGEKIHVRVLARGTSEWSEYSDSYPVYPSGEAPHYPEGLWVQQKGVKAHVTWGQILGAGKYTLYRRIKGEKDFVSVYTGEERNIFIDQPDSVNIYEFTVTATNGVGESPMSPVSDTDEARIVNWYPVPGELYRRVTTSYEQGYPEWNHLIELELPVLTYPVD